jgi:hypothetical protein
MLRKVALASLCLALSANAAFAACAGPREVAALKIASLQQRLMVAGLACPSLNGKGASDSYNRFVLAHRAELQRSDDDLKAYFIANGGEAGYDTYKTRAANLAAHGPATNQDAFCAVAATDFRNLVSSGDLQQAAAYESLMAGQACETPVLAAAKAEAPMRLARNEDVVTAAPREMPAMPYAEAPPPRPQPAAREEIAEAPQVAVATRDDYARAPLAVAAGRGDYADLPPRPAASRDNARYWYYRRLYRSGD